MLLTLNSSLGTNGLDSKTGHGSGTEGASGDAANSTGNEHFEKGRGRNRNYFELFPSLYTVDLSELKKHITSARVSLSSQFLVPRGQFGLSIFFFGLQKAFGVLQRLYHEFKNDSKIFTMVTHIAIQQYCTLSDTLYYA